MVVVVPAYQAAATIADLVARVRRARPGAAVLVVDDGSRDDTGERAAAAADIVIAHDVNLGKGRALATGLAAAVQRTDARFVVTLDADLQHPPESIPALLAPLASGHADLVVGARARDAGAMPPQRRFTNWLSSTLVSRAIGAAVPDSQSGFRAMTRAVAEAVRPAGRRYEFETEFLFDAAAAGFRIAAVPVPTVYEGRTSHFRAVEDTMALSGVFLRHWRDILGVS